MSKITISQTSLPIIIFNSDEWENSNEYSDVAEEIIAFMKEHDDEVLLVQNTSFTFGDTKVNPLIMIRNNDFGGFKGTLDLFIRIFYWIYCRTTI
jgi:hypothetical protein